MAGRAPPPATRRSLSAASTPMRPDPSQMDGREPGLHPAVAHSARLGDAWRAGREHLRLGADGAFVSTARSSRISSSTSWSMRWATGWGSARWPAMRWKARGEAQPAAATLRRRTARRTASPPPTDRAGPRQRTPVRNDVASGLPRGRPLRRSRLRRSRPRPGGGTSNTHGDDHDPCPDRPPCPDRRRRHARADRPGAGGHRSRLRRPLLARAPRSSRAPRRFDGSTVIMRGYMAPAAQGAAPGSSCSPGCR